MTQPALTPNDLIAELQGTHSEDELRLRLSELFGPAPAAASEADADD